MSVLLSEQEVFNLAMEIEKSGKAFYETVLSGAPYRMTEELFSFLAGEEQKHYDYFNSLRKQTGNLIVQPEDWDEISEYIKATTDSRFFIGEDKAIQTAKKAKDVLDAIEIAIGFEKDTLLFFYELLNVTPEGSRDAAQKIVDEEKKHIMLLSEKRKEIKSGSAV
jgi:rubrerythrin